MQYLMVQVLIGVMLSSLAFGEQKKGTLILSENALSASGEAQYQIDSTGSMRVWGQAKSWLLGSYNFDDKYEVNPVHLRSHSFTVMNTSVPFDGLTLNVIHVDAKNGKSVAKGLSKNGWVTFHFDISSEIVDLEAVHFEGDVIPIQLKLIRKS